MPAPRFQHGFANDVFISYTREDDREEAGIRWVRQPGLSIACGAKDRYIVGVPSPVGRAAVDRRRRRVGQLCRCRDGRNAADHDKKNDEMPH